MAVIALMVLVCIAGGLEWASRWIERNIERSRVVTENGENYAIKAVAAARAADSLNCLINILWNLGLTKDNVDSAEMILKECINLSDRYGNNFMDGLSSVFPAKTSILKCNAYMATQ